MRYSVMTLAHFRLLLHAVAHPYMKPIKLLSLVPNIL